MKFYWISSFTLNIISNPVKAKKTYTKESIRVIKIEMLRINSPISSIITIFRAGLVYKQVL